MLYVSLNILIHPYSFEFRLLYFCNLWKSFQFLEAKGLIWVWFSESWLQQIKTAWPRGCCFACRGFWRDYPNMNSILAEIGHSQLVEGLRAGKVGHDPGKALSPKCDPQHGPLKTHKKHLKWKPLLPTDICKVFFWSSIFWVYFTLGSRSLNHQSCTKFAQEVGIDSVPFWGVLEGWQSHIAIVDIVPISPCHPSKYTQSLFQIGQIYSTKFWVKYFIWVNYFVTSSVSRRTLLQHDLLSIFISVFLNIPIKAFPQTAQPKRFTAATIATPRVFFFFELPGGQGMGPPPHFLSKKKQCAILWHPNPNFNFMPQLFSGNPFKITIDFSIKFDDPFFFWGVIFYKRVCWWGCNIIFKNKVKTL